MKRDPTIILQLHKLFNTLAEKQGDDKEIPEQDLTEALKKFALDLLGPVEPKIEYTGRTKNFGIADFNYLKQLFKDPATERDSYLTVYKAKYYSYEIS